MDVSVMCSSLGSLQENCEHAQQRTEHVFPQKYALCQHSLESSLERITSERSPETGTLLCP